MDKRKPVPADYARLEQLYALCSSKDGAVAYAVSFWGDAEYQSRIECIENGAVSIVTSGKHDSLPAFTPDGKKLVFLSDGCLVRFDRAQKRVETIYAPEGREVTGYALAEDVGTLAVVSRVEIAEQPPEGCDWVMPLVAEELRYRNDRDHGFAKKYEYRLDVVSADGTARTVLTGARDWKHLLFLPDGKRLLYAQDGYSVLDLVTGESKALSEGFLCAGALTPPVLSHDGTFLLACGREKDAPGSELTLRKIDLETGALAGSDDTAPAGVFNGEGCGDSVYASLPSLARSETNGIFKVTAYEDGHIGVYCVDASGELLRWERATPPGGAYVCIATPCDGALPCLYTDWAHPTEVCLLDLATGERTAIAHHNTWLDGVALSGMREFKVPALDGKTCLSGWVMLPEGADNAPVLLWPHGGPAGFYSDAFSLEKQAVAARGYAIVLPNPRGSTGFGPAYEDTAHAFDGGAGIDCLTILDAALREFSQLDPLRTGVIGGSYGGYMAAWMAGNTHRFKAAVVLKAVTNWLYIHFKSSQGGQPVFDEYRDFQDFLVDTVKKSPIYHAGDVAIPTLIIHGEKDQVCPVENAHQFYVAVRDTHPDLPARLIVMPNCCHAYHRDDVRDYQYIQDQSLEWLDQYV